MIKIEVNGQQLEAREGSTIIEVADSAGIYIPRFCYHEKLSVAANCRMCLVEVENAPKALPACATPVAEGMVVHTVSEKAVAAQQDTMEFLLINHPLDCPICDQGGECPLQDQAVGYGGDASRYTEGKRTVESGDIGSLIATEMTRCIHCTRCVRFGQEVAGIMELGAIGRGEDMKISTFMGGAIKSEVSGNAIDLCPVGALTSKPYRFSARSWELIQHKGISPHDCLGSNLDIHEVNGVVKRVLPRDNESVNECWLSDRDRYSYEAVNSSDRLTLPLIRKGDIFHQAEWSEALEVAAESLRRVHQKTGGSSIGSLCTPTATLEEFFLLQKVLRGLDSSSIDHRLRQQDFRDDPLVPIFPGSRTPVTSIHELDAVLLVGCNIRKELPLLALRIRAMTQRGGRVGALNSLQYDFNFPVAHQVTVPPTGLAGDFALLACTLAQKLQKEVPGWIITLAGTVDVAPEAEDLAEMLLSGDRGSLIVLGQVSCTHQNSSRLRSLAFWIHENCDIGTVFLPDANSAAAWLAGCVPHRGPNGVALSEPGFDARAMVEERLRAYILYGLEVDCDYAEPLQLSEALSSADFVLSFSCFRSAVPAQADVVLPVAPFTEIDGTYVNLEGRFQTSVSAVSPSGQARPGWKILRVLGNLLELEGFGYVSADEVAREIAVPVLPAVGRGTTYQDSDQHDEDGRSPALVGKGNRVCRIMDIPIYETDPIVRRAPALQATADATVARVHVDLKHLTSLGLSAGDKVRVSGQDGRVILPVKVDDRVPAGSVYIPGGCPETAPLGSSSHVIIEAEV